MKNQNTPAAFAAMSEQELTSVNGGSTSIVIAACAIAGLYIVDLLMKKARKF